jgi:hypothetical protein
MKKFNKTFNITLLSLLLSSFQLLADEGFYEKSRGISIPSMAKGVSDRREALIVGVSDYARDNQDLNGIEKDVAKMKQLFLNLGFNVKVLKNEESMNILSNFTHYANELTSKDTFAFYYSGHGSHTKDMNNDEADGQDETLVLSDGKINKNLIDDILYKKLNDIKAKKIVFFDSCHSGTAFRSLGGKTQAKSMKPEDVTESFKLSSSKGISVGGDSMSDQGDFVVFSSSQDTEESLATPTGSLFTNAISEVFSDKQLQSKSLNEVKKIVGEKVLNYAKETDGIPHHPSINYSSSSIGSRSLASFINTKSIPTTSVNRPTPLVSNNTLQETFENLLASGKLEKLSLNYRQTTYQTGSSVEFEVDTQQTRGYLTVFYIDKDDVTVLYPNPFVKSTPLQGKYRFPQDLAHGQFELEAYKSCTGCQEEKTTIYAMLSAQPIKNIKEVQSKGLKSFGNNSNESKIISRAVRIKATAKSTALFTPKLGKYEFIVK